jgi:excisionase family DNA binding protein
VAPSTLNSKDKEMAKKEIEQLTRRIELLEMQIKELRTVDPVVINERLKTIEDALYTTKDILNMKEVCQYLDISQSLLYKLTCSGEIPHFKPRGKMIFFEKKELIEWIKRNRENDSAPISPSIIIETDKSGNYEEKVKKEQH